MAYYRERKENGANGSTPKDILEISARVPNFHYLLSCFFFVKVKEAFDGNKKGKGFSKAIDKEN